MACAEPRDPPRFHIRPMAEADLPQAVEIEALSFSHPWTRAQFLEEVGRGAAARCLVSEDGEGVCGYVIGWLAADQLHVANLAVHPRCRGLGVARGLLERLLRQAAGDGAAWCGLEVRASNAAAIRLYRGMGFAAAGIRRRYYQDGEDALVLERDLPRQGGSGAYSLKK